MLQSQLFYKTLKDAPKDEVSLNAQLLIRGGFVDKLMAGIYTLLPLGLRVVKNIENIIREEMGKVGGQEVFMPSMQPRENWEKTDRWTIYDGLLKTGLDEEKNIVLGPTHEEIISPLAQKHISSYKDLPKYLYQFQNKFRGEKRAKSGLLRGREFIMKDLYSFHDGQEDLDDYYEKVTQAYKNIFDRAGIGRTTYLTYASGGTFSKYSHEFQTLTEAGEDIIHICDKCHVAVNREIIEDLNHSCPQCGNKELREAKAVEVGNIFKLGTKYSKPFDLTYTDKEGNKKLVIMGCYGIGLQRLMGTIVEVLHDEKGMIWPVSVAPFKVHLVEISKGNDNVSAEAKKLYDELTEKGIEVLYDDRKEISAGQKFAESDLLGSPYRVVVSGKTKEKLELKKRDEDSLQMVTREELLKIVKS